MRSSTFALDHPVEFASTPSEHCRTAQEHSYTLYDHPPARSLSIMSLDQIHTPSSTAPALPPSATSSSTGSSVQTELKRLTEQRANIQAQLDVYFSVLSSVRPPFALILPSLNSSSPALHPCRTMSKWTPP